MIVLLLQVCPVPGPVLLPASLKPRVISDHLSLSSVRVVPQNITDMDKPVLAAVSTVDEAVTAAVDDDDIEVCLVSEQAAAPLTRHGGIYHTHGEESGRCYR